MTKDDSINVDNSNQIIYLNKKSYILPKNNITYYIENGLFEKHLMEWCKQFCDMNKCFLDIGAHSGTYTIGLAQYCKHVYAFEPQKMSYYALCGSVVLSNLNNVTCINVGLGDDHQCGYQTLNIVSVDGGGSSLHINHHPILNTEKIKIKTLDSFNIDNIGLIKMDIEENEYQALCGSVETLKRCNYPKILFEMNVKNNLIIQFLTNLNYKVVNINGCQNMYLATQD